MNVSMKTVWTIAIAWVTIGVLCAVFGQNGERHLDSIVNELFFAFALQLTVWSNPANALGPIGRALTSRAAGVLGFVVLALAEAVIYRAETIVLVFMLIAVWISFTAARRT